MSGAVCPACGVAVVPGYVRCPKCHRPLPRFARNSISPVGGTAVETTGSKASPLLALLVAAAVAGGFIWFFAFRKHHEGAVAGTGSGSAGAMTAPAPGLTPAPVPNVAAPAAPPPQSIQPTVHADEIAQTLERRLKRQRLWSTVTVVGDHVDVRSGSCSDGGMKPAIEAVASSFHAAGLTRLRCVEQSGTVAFARDL